MGSESLLDPREDQEGQKPLISRISRISRMEEGTVSG